MRRWQCDREAESGCFCFWRPALALFGCGSAPSSEKAQNGGATSKGDAPALEEVELALNWFPEAEHGGYFAALVHGYYTEAGLAVKILPGGASAAVPQRVASQRVAFGIENADRVLSARAQEAEIVALMAPCRRARGPSWCTPSRKFSGSRTSPT